MNLLRHRYRSWLVPYVDGTLDAQRQAKLEALLARDPVLAAEAEAQRRAVKRLHETALASKALTEAPEARLWPAIEARLEPRRRSAGPLILMGGLCAAAASLAWAAFWGPLSHRGGQAHPPAVVAVDPSGSSEGVTVIGPINSRSHRHVIHKPHHISILVKRPASLKAVPLPPRNDEPSSQDLQNDYLAANDSGPADTQGNEEPGGTAVPRLAVGGKPQFRLAPLIHTIGPDTAREDANTASPGQSSSGDAQAGNDTSSPGASASPTETTSIQAQTGPVTAAHPPVTRRRRHHHRRHRHARAAKSVKSGGNASANNPSSETISGVMGAASEGRKVKLGLID